MGKVRIIKKLGILILGFIFGLVYCNIKINSKKKICNDLNERNSVIVNDYLDNNESKINLQITNTSPNTEVVIIISCDNLFKTNLITVTTKKCSKNIIINAETIKLLSFFWDQIDFDSYTKCSLHDLKVSDEEKIHLTLTQYNISKNYDFYLPTGIAPIEVLTEKNLASFNSSLLTENSGNSNINQYIKSEASIMAFFNILKSVALQE
jgi:hypothetical protein